MGIRFRKSFRLLPGFKLNVGKRGISVSAGTGGARYTVGTHGHRASVGAPGTGVSYTTKLGSKKRKSDHDDLPPFGSIGGMADMIIGLAGMIGLGWLIRWAWFN